MPWPYLKVIGEAAIKAVGKNESGIHIAFTKNAVIPRFMHLYIEIRFNDNSIMRVTVAKVMKELALRDSIMFCEISHNMRQQREFLIPLQETELNLAVSLELFCDEDREHRSRTFALQ